MIRLLNYYTTFSLFQNATRDLHVSMSSSLSLQLMENKTPGSTSRVFIATRKLRPRTKIIKSDFMLTAFFGISVENICNYDGIIYKCIKMHETKRVRLSQKEKQPQNNSAKCSADSPRGSEYLPLDTNIVVTL